MKRSTFFLLAGVGVVAGYFLWRRYQDQQRAAAHPITIAPEATLIKPLPVNPALVSDAVIVA